MSAESPRAWLRPILEPLRPVFREVLVMSFFINVLALAVPVFVLQVYDRVVFHAGISTLWGLAIGMVMVLIFDYVLRMSRSRILQTVALRVDVVVGRSLFDKFVALPLQTLESQPGAHWQAMFRDVDTVRNTLSGASAVLIADLPFVVLFLGLILVIAPKLAPVLLLIVPLFMLVAWRSGAVMAKANMQERDSSMSRDGLIAEVVAGRTTIKALALDRAMRPIWEEKHAENIQNAIQRGGKADGYTNLGTTLTMMTTITLTSVGAILIINQELTMGGLIATNMLSGRLLGPLNQLVGQWRTYSAFKQAVERLGRVFATPSERMISEVKLDRPRGDITIENVTFGYSEDAPPVVNKVNLTIKTGGINALVGRNGSGKTTLLKLIQGLYQPTEGRVLLDGADIAQFTRAELAEWIGYVPQENVLFMGTVRDNVSHRMPEASDEEIIKAATAAGVHSFIIDLPDGYGTEIGEAGRRLSGGQRQRIAIARALVGDPPVVLLDEPSASLDRQAEQELRNTLNEIGKERTVIVVTHSPILLSVCDNLVALDRGKVALAGPAKDILPRLLGGAKPAAEPEPRVAADARAQPPKKPAAETAQPGSAATKPAPGPDPQPILHTRMEQRIRPTTEAKPPMPPPLPQAAKPAAPPGKPAATAQAAPKDGPSGMIKLQAGAETSPRAPLTANRAEAKPGAGPAPGSKENKS